jgi:phage tail-like protein
MADRDVYVPGIPTNYFCVEIESIRCGKFRSCEGLEAETYVYEIEEGGLNSNTHKFLGRNRFPNLILENGITDNNDLYQWYEETAMTDKAIERKSVTIALYDINGNEIKRWNLFRALPCRWIGPHLSVDGQGMSIEKIEITHEGIRVE